MQNVSRNILKRMRQFLSIEQLNMLQKVMSEEFLKEKCRKIESNEKLLSDFIQSKKYENCSPQTIQIYLYENQKFIAWLDKSIADVTKKDIEKYLIEYREKHNISNVTLNNMRRYISAFFAYLECEDIIVCNPVRKIKPVKEIKTVKMPFTEFEIEELRENVSTLRDKAIIDTLNTTGVRVSELCNMDIDDIKDRTAVIRGKGNKERIVYFSEKAWHNVKKYLDNRNDTSSALFVSLKRCGDTYNRISKSAVESMIRNAGRKNDITAHPHKFRRTVASRAANKGMPIQEIQVLLGHSKIDTTMIYCNVNESNIKLSHERFIG